MVLAFGNAYDDCKRSKLYHVCKNYIVHLRPLHREGAGHDVGYVGILAPKSMLNLL